MTVDFDERLQRQREEMLLQRIKMIDMRLDRMEWELRMAIEKCETVEERLMSERRKGNV